MSRKRKANSRKPVLVNKRYTAPKENLKRRK